MPQVRPDNEAASVTYTVTFEPDFDFVKGGKLPGLCGGPKTITGGDAVTGKEGWSARIMWRKDGRGQAYVYHMNQPSKYGDEFDFPADFQFVKGKPYQFQIAVRMNKMGKRDGKLTVTLLEKGKPRVLVAKEDMQWRAAREVGVDSILFNTFHGGNDSSWGPSKDCHAVFESFRWTKE
jgi:hypothetical protein